MKNILINAYAVSPNWGSEPGMGWNWIINLAKYCKVHVITEGEWAEDIQKVIMTLPQKENIKFYYIPVAEKVRRMCWNQGDWRFYWYYRKWQQKAFEKSLEIISKNRIDVIHQLNMIGFREPGYLWKIKDIPYVWGPVGGMGDIPTSYLKGASIRQKVFCLIKNFISNIQIRFSHRVRAAVKRGVMIAATKETRDKVKKYYDLDINVINETGCYPGSTVENSDNKTESSDKFDILWVGKFDFRKQFELALRSISKMQNKHNINFHVVSPFDSSSHKVHIENMVDKYGLSRETILYGRIPNKMVHEIMQQADVFFFTSIMEGTPHVVLEALQNNLPILCFNTCGQGEVVDASIGSKIELSDIERSSSDFARELDRWFSNREILKEKSRNCKIKQLDCSWENKVKKMQKIYRMLVKDETNN